MPLFDQSLLEGKESLNQLTTSLQQCAIDVEGAWRISLHDFMSSEVGQSLLQYVDVELRRGVTVYPATPFLALQLTPLESVRVVILGQDPYHGENQAQGLAFSVQESVKIPPSLRNMFKELHRDLQIPAPPNGSLIRWAKQGVLLLNASLTVRAGEAASHAKRGWEVLSDALVRQVAMKTQPVVFMLWGAHAQKKKALILEAMQQTGVEHLILKANHPSPLSATKAPIPFIGCGHFRATNEFLKQKQLGEIDW